MPPANPPTPNTPGDASAARRRMMPVDDLSEDDLARDWSLTPEDLVFVATCRGPDHRRRFALQLCMLRTHGRFLDDFRQAPVKIINHLSRQLALPPVLALDRSGRAQTERAQASASAAIWAWVGSTKRWKVICAKHCVPGLSRAAAATNC